MVRGEKGWYKMALDGQHKNFTEWALSGAVLVSQGSDGVDRRAGKRGCTKKGLRGGGCIRVHQRTSRAVENKALIVESITSNHEGWWGGRGGYICAIVKRAKGSTRR